LGEDDRGCCGLNAVDWAAAPRCAVVLGEGALVVSDSHEEQVLHPQRATRDDTRADRRHDVQVLHAAVLPDEELHR
jgi:hypothetical protein